MRDDGRGRIVVGVDGSVGSLAALRWAGREARLRRSALHVVRVWEPPSAGVAAYARHPGGSDAEARGVADAALHAAVAAALGPAGSTEVVVRLADGRPEQVLPRLAADADLLILGSHPHREDPPVAVGPTLRACLRHAPCAVVVVTAPRPAPRTPLPVPAAEPATARG